MKLPLPGQSVLAGRTVGGSDIALYRFGAGPLPVLLLAGVHGDESEGYLFLERFLDQFGKGVLQPPAGVSLFLCPRANPDGCRANRRTNERNVDLNRNLPTLDWTGTFENVRYYPGPMAGSELETECVLNIIREIIEPAGNGLVLSLHSYDDAMINFNGECSDLAQGMSEHNGLPPKGDIGYPTPGSLGTYCGWERNIPTITLEIKRGQQPEAVWVQHLEGILFAVSYYSKHALPQRKQPERSPQSRAQNAGR